MTKLKLLAIIRDTAQLECEVLLEAVSEGIEKRRSKVFVLPWYDTGQFNPLMNIKADQEIKAILFRNWVRG